MEIINVLFYTTDSRKQPFVEWIEDLDIKTKSVVLTRIARIRRGNMGDHKSIKGSDIFELIIDYGPGYRIYFGKQGTKIVVLLVGGDKGSQSRDITKAQQYWLKYKGKLDAKK